MSLQSHQTSGHKYPEKEKCVWTELVKSLSFLSPFLKQNGLTTIQIGVGYLHNWKMNSIRAGMGQVSVAEIKYHGQRMEEIIWLMVA